MVPPGQFGFGGSIPKQSLQIDKYRQNLKCVLDLQNKQLIIVKPRRNYEANMYNTICLEV
jgi:hypothetical protein